MEIKHPMLPHSPSFQDFPDGSDGKESACNARDPSLILGSGRSAGEGIGYPLQYSWASLMAQMVKNPRAVQESWVGKIPWKRERLCTPGFLAAEFHRQGAWQVTVHMLAELDMTE